MFIFSNVGDFYVGKSACVRVYMSFLILFVHVFFRDVHIPMICFFLFWGKRRLRLSIDELLNMMFHVSFGDFHNFMIFRTPILEKIACINVFLICFPCVFQRFSQFHYFLNFLLGTKRLQQSIGESLNIT